MLGPGHVAEGHLHAVRGADAHVLQVSQRAPLRLRVADHHADVVAAALDALGLLAVERLADLAPQVGPGQAQRLGGGQDVELEFLLAPAERVRDVQYPGKGRERALEPGRRLAQLIHVGAAQADGQRVSQVEERGGENQLHRVRNRPRDLPPALRDIAGADRAVLGADQLHGHFAQVRVGEFGRVHSQAGLAALRDGSRLVADRDHDVLDQAAPVLGELAVDLLAQALAGGLQPAQRRLRGLDGRACRQRQQGGDVVGLDEGKEGETHPAARDRAQRPEQQAERGGGRGVAPAQAGLNRPAVSRVGEAFEGRWRCGPGSAASGPSLHRSGHPPAPRGRGPGARAGSAGTRPARTAARRSRSRPSSRTSGPCFPRRTSAAETRRRWSTPRRSPEP